MITTLYRKARSEAFIQIRHALFMELRDNVCADGAILLSDGLHFTYEGDILHFYHSTKADSILEEWGTKLELYPPAGCHYEYKINNEGVSSHFHDSKKK